MYRRFHLAILICLAAALPCFVIPSSSRGQDAAGQTTEAAKSAEKPVEGEPPKPDASEKEKTADAAGSAKESAKPEAKKTARVSKTKEADKSPAKKQIRLIEMSGNYVDLVQPLGLDPTSLLLGGEQGKQKSFYKLCDYFEELAKDEAVKWVVFDLSDSALSFNPAQLDELARRLEKLKAADKKLAAWLENPGNIQLSIAASCNKVVLGDFGAVDMPSMNMESMFYRDAMDLLGVQASVVRAGNFKGAVEPYINPQMSSHLRAHYLDMLTSINDAQVSRIAKGRGLTTAVVRELQKKRMLLPSEAQAKGLVDQLAPYGSMKESINAIVGEELEWTKPKTAPKREVSVFELMSKLMSGDKKSATTSAKEASIAILHLSGAIEDGKKESSGSIVSGPTVKAIDELIKDDNVKGVVVRINSPGGSATASEAIRRALNDLAQKKPTVFSMGEMAASGGYWITCIGQPIYAERGTITGSIGVFSLKISLGTMLRRVGVHVESIALDSSAESDSMNRAWTEDDIANMQAFIDDVYGKFLKLASDSRKMPVDTVANLAGGRVWSGSQAKQNGLIDEIGGLDDAIAAVSKKASVEKPKLIHRPVVKSGLDLMDLLGEEESNEISMGSTLSPLVIKQLRNQGYSLTGTMTLIRSALNPESRAPKAWALMPSEFKIQ
ncbi:MAG: signal peptide peptidase SppA [Pirellulales bacterium]